MWPSLGYRCDACHAFTVVPARLFHPGACARCHRPLDLRGRPHLVHGTAAGEAVRESPVPVILIFASRWEQAKASDHLAVEALARALSGEVTVLVVDVVTDVASLSVWRAHGCPRAVLLSRGNEIGRGSSYPSEGPVRYVLAHAALQPPGEPPRVAA